MQYFHRCSIHVCFRLSLLYFESLFYVVSWACFVVVFFFFLSDAPSRHWYHLLVAFTPVFSLLLSQLGCPLHLFVLCHVVWLVSVGFFAFKFNRHAQLCVISTFLWFLDKNLLTLGTNYDHDTSKSMGKKFYLFIHFKWHFTCLKNNIQKWFCEINGHKLLSGNDTFININVD